MPSRLRRRRFAFEIAENGKNEPEWTRTSGCPLLEQSKSRIPIVFSSDDVRQRSKGRKRTESRAAINDRIPESEKSLAAFQIQLGFGKYFGIIFFRDFAWG
jgi:hypothetical protein